MDKDITCIKVVLAEKECAASLLGDSWRDTKEPISGWQNSWVKTPQQSASGVPTAACPPLETLMQIARVLGVTADDLLRLEELPAISEQ